MTCPDTHEWDLLAMEALDDSAAGPLRVHAKECPACQRRFEQARRAHLDRIRMYDGFDRGHDSLREQLMAALPAAPARSQTDRLVRGWRYMGDVAVSIKHRVGARAVIGMVSVAACAAIILLAVTFAGGRSAFATAIEQFRNARTIVCRVSSPTPVSAGPMSFDFDGTLYVSSEHGSRMELLMNGSVAQVQYMPPGGPMTMVTPLARQYMIIDTTSAGPGPETGANPDDFLRALGRLTDKASRELGRQEIDGVEAIGYEISGAALGLGSGDQIRSELWIDAETHLPVRYFVEMPGPTEAPLQMVFDEFQWDTPLDPDLFVPDIPADYTRIDAVMPTPDEAALIKGLGSYVELTGKYPPKLDLSVIMTDMMTAMFKRMDSQLREGHPVPDQQTITQKGVEIGSGIAYYQRLVGDGRSPEYYGKDVSPGQADAVLVRWKLSDGGWRVIYGDLRVETVFEE
jgi:hypothetical protein